MSCQLRDQSPSAHAVTSLYSHALPPYLPSLIPYPAMSSHLIAPRAFTCFPRLPLELRRKIWSNALPARLVAVYPEILTPSLTWNLQIEATTIPILQVSREAREEGLRGYTKFSCQTPTLRSTECATPLRYLQPSSLWQLNLVDDPETSTHCYINLSLDTIYLEYSYDMPSFSIATRFLGTGLEKVQNLALDYEYCAFDPRSHQELRNLSLIREPVFVVTESLQASPRREGKERPYLNIVDSNYRRPGFEDFPFRFMFQEITDDLLDEYKEVC